MYFWWTRSNYDKDGNFKTPLLKTPRRTCREPLKNKTVRPVKFATPKCQFLQVFPLPLFPLSALYSACYLCYHFPTLSHQMYIVAVTINPCVFTVHWLSVMWMQDAKKMPLKSVLLPWLLQRVTFLHYTQQFLDFRWVLAYMQFFSSGDIIIIIIYQLKLDIWDWPKVKWGHDG